MVMVRLDEGMLGGGCAQSCTAKAQASVKSLSHALLSNSYALVGAYFALEDFCWCSYFSLTQ